MTRWWAGADTAAATLDLIDGSDLGTEVGMAVLGLHGIGAGVLSKGISDSHSMQPVYDDIEASITPVRKAWGTAFDDYVDDPDVYADGRVLDLKRDADAGFSTAVRALTASQVPWPLAVQRAAAAYGLPPKPALAYVRKVASPVVAPAVLEHEADQALAAYAAHVASLETELADEVVSKRSDGDVVKAKQSYHGDDPDERDAQGRFAPKGGARDIKRERRDKRRRRRRSATATAASIGPTERTQAARRDFSAATAERKAQVEAAKVAADTARYRELRAEAEKHKTAKATPTQAAAAKEQNKALTDMLLRQYAKVHAKTAAKAKTTVQQATLEDLADAIAEEDTAKLAAVRRASLRLYEHWDEIDYDFARDRVEAVLTTRVARVYALPTELQDAIVEPKEFSASGYTNAASVEQLESVIYNHYGADFIALFKAHSAESMRDTLESLQHSGKARTTERPGEIEVQTMVGDWVPITFNTVRGATVEVDPHEVEAKEHTKGAAATLDEKMAREFSPYQFFYMGSSDAADEMVQTFDGAGLSLLGEEAYSVSHAADASSVPTKETNYADSGVDLGDVSTPDWNSPLLGSGSGTKYGYDDDTGYEYGKRASATKKRAALVKRDEYYGDDPDERDSRGRFAAKGSGSANASQREDKRQRQSRARQRRRRGARMASTPLTSPRREAAAAAFAGQARAEAQRRADDEVRSLAQLVPTGVTRQVQKPQRRDASSINQALLQAYTRKHAQSMKQRRELRAAATRPPGVGQSSPARSRPQGAPATLDEKLGDVLALGSQIAVIEPDPFDRFSSVNELVGEQQKEADAAYRDTNTGRVTEDQHRDYLRRRLVGTYATHPDSDRLTVAAAYSAVVGALVNAVAQAEYASIPLSDYGGNDELRNSAIRYLKDKGATVASSRVTRLDEHGKQYETTRLMRSRIKDDPPIALVFGGAGRADSVVDRLATDGTVYQNVSTNTVEMATLIRSQMAERGVRDRGLEQRLDAVIGAPPLPIDVLGVK